MRWYIDRAQTQIPFCQLKFLAPISLVRLTSYTCCHIILLDLIQNENKILFCLLAAVSDFHKANWTRLLSTVVMWFDSLLLFSFSICFSFFNLCAPTAFFILLWTVFGWQRMVNDGAGDEQRQNGIIIFFMGVFPYTTIQTVFVDFNFGFFFLSPSFLLLTTD